MEIKTKVFYSELPSRNVYVDSVVNELSGYYPARSEFTIEYNNEIEQDLTDVCALYDGLVNQESDEEGDSLELLPKVKSEPGTVERVQIKEEPEAVVDKSVTLSTQRSRKRNNEKSEYTERQMKRRKLDVKENMSVMCRDTEVKREGIDDSSSEADVKPSASAADSEEVFKELCIAAVDIYNNRLRDRNERKEFVRNHGFLDQKKIYSWYNIHNLELGDGSFNTLVKKFIKLFDTASDFDKFIQQLKLEKELRMKLLYLDDLRRNGVRHKKMIPLYTKLKASRNSVHAEIRNLDISDIILLSEQLADNASLPEKRVSRTLEISHLEKYKLLTEEERELCSIHRLTPVSYLSFKQILMDECKKLGSLKLAQARTMLKIDVNKTRRVYDYLIEKNLIWKE